MILPLSSKGANSIPNKVKTKLKDYKYVFNPSYINFEGLSYLVVRVYDSDIKSILSILYIWDLNYKITEVNLSQFFKDRLGINKVADTKLFIMNNGVWGTFNSGYEETIDNTLVLFQIEKLHIRKYYSCLFEQRNRVEKNWAFYYRNGQIHALYSLDGLVVLKAILVKAETILFEKMYSNKNVNLGTYSIGTPLAQYKGDYVFMAHKKIIRNGKRLYLGKPFLFKYEADVPSLKMTSKKYFVHSYKSLLGAAHKFNKSLISCTYFSGIFISKENAVLAYGINDISWKVVKLKIARIWR